MQQLALPLFAFDRAIAADEKIAAGIVFVAPDGDVLLLRRSSTEENFPGHWSLPGGKADTGELPEQTARREALEEMGDHPLGDLHLLDQRTTPTGMQFHTFRQSVETKFVPKLNDEHCGYAWAPRNALPEPLHPAVKDVLSWPIASDRAIAFDKASVRKVDEDGRLRVAVTNISKANVCPYLGNEIPDYDTLGLQADRIYKLLRDPDELEKAAPTFNNIQLLLKHVPVSADDHQPDLVVGTTGSEAEFVAPYLRNSLAIWVREGIDLVESEVQKELSSAYRYRADMTPGTFEGEQYDGVMRDIVGNHVALVKEGRAGSDVVVGDAALNTIVTDLMALDAFNEGDHPRSSNGEFGSGGSSGGSSGSGGESSEQKTRIKAGLKQVQAEHTELKKKLDSNTITEAETKRLDAINKFVLKHKDAISSLKSKGSAADSAINQLSENFQMAKSLLSRKASVAQGALMVFLKPRLAKDAKIDLGPVLKGINAKNFKDKKAGVLTGVTDLVRDKLATKIAKDANIEGLLELVDALQEVGPAEDEDDDVAVDPDDAGMDADPVEAMRGFLKGKMADDDVEKACAMMKPKAMDETPEEKEAREKKEKEAAAKKTAEDAEGEEDKKDMVKKPVMDAAIKVAEDAATKRAEANTMKRLNGIRIAERAVEPLIGKVTTALDSADAIYLAALKHAGVKTEGVDPSAFPALVDMAVQSAAAKAKPNLHVAQDAAIITDRAAFEKANGIEPMRIRHLS